MSDDRFKDAGHFHPVKAWEKITRANKDRAFDAKHPLSRWERFWIPTSIIMLVTGLLGCAVYLLVWAFGAPYA